MCSRFIFSILFAIFVGSGTALTAFQTKQEVLKPEEYAVYSTLINSITRGMSDAAILIHDQTFISGEAQQMDNGVEPEVRADFTAKNDTSYQLRPDFKLTNKYRLIQGKDGGRGLQSSELVIGPSRVGINRAEDQAIVRIRYGGMGGMGWKDQLVVLSKRNKRWEVERKINRMVPLTVVINEAKDSDNT
jgi:hypothetical protein